MNIYDISRKAGVSIATVSRVLNGNTNVSVKTREKVLAVIDESGYTPNVFARGLGLNTMKTVGIMCTDSSDIYLANAVYFLERELRNNGYDSILSCTGTSLDNKQKSLELLLSKRVDAIILAGSQFISPEISADNAYIRQAAKQLPVICVNGYLNGKNIYTTVCDDYKAMYEVTAKLINSGRRSIMYLYTSNSYSGRNKLAGYTDALKDYGIDKNDSLIRMCTKTIDSAKCALSSAFNEHIIFDAVIASDDSLAVGAVKFAYENNLSVPDKLSIIGYNNSILACCTQPELSSVDSRLEELCINAVNTLMQVFDGQPADNHSIVTADIIQRNTTNF